MAEVSVKVIQKFLKLVVYQGQSWEELLPSLEVAYDDTTQASTGQIPFYLNYGHHPTGITRHEPVDNPHAEDHVQYLLRLQDAARDAIHDQSTAILWTKVMTRNSATRR
jgi:hypothetical protein